MKIRPASPQDAKAITPLMLLAMDDIVARFLHSNDPRDAIVFMETLIAQENNQYSYENIHVVEHEDQIVGAMCIYDGALLHTLREPVKAYVESKTNGLFEPEDETEEGEYYIDCLAVLPEYQGKGIGKSLLRFAIETYVKSQGKVLGLLVEKLEARKLYEKVGFTFHCTKTLTGKPMAHMQLIDVHQCG
jgi:ribosomal protein S18 acetylase RimI-like enzyme